MRLIQALNIASNSNNWVESSIDKRTTYQWQPDGELGVTIKPLILHSFGHSYLITWFGDTHQGVPEKVEKLVRADQLKISGTTGSIIVDSAMAAVAVGVAIRRELANC